MATTMGYLKERERRICCSEEEEGKIDLRILHNISWYRKGHEYQCVHICNACCYYTGPECTFYATLHFGYEKILVSS